MKFLKETNYNFSVQTINGKWRKRIQKNRREIIYIEILSTILTQKEGNQIKHNINQITKK